MTFVEKKRNVKINAQVLILAVGVILLIIFPFLLESSWTTTLSSELLFLFPFSLSSSRMTTSSEQPAAIPPRKIFVDLGANCGNTYLERKKQFDQEGGWEVYLWEPSPQMHTFFLNDLAEQNPGITILPFAAGVVDKKIQLFIHRGQEGVTKKSQFRDKGKCDPKSPYNPSGGSTMFRGAKAAGKPVDINQADFPKWLAEKKLRAGIDRFIFKLDIEGAELDIMDVLMSTDNDDSSICVAETIEMEFHKRIFREGTEDFVKHEKFEEHFFANFEKKCGRKPNFKRLH